MKKKIAALLVTAIVVASSIGITVFADPNKGANWPIEIIEPCSTELTIDVGFDGVGDES